MKTIHIARLARTGTPRIWVVFAKGDLMTKGKARESKHDVLRRFGSEHNIDIAKGIASQEIKVIRYRGTSSLAELAATMVHVDTINESEG